MMIHRPGPADGGRGPGESAGRAWCGHGWSGGAAARRRGWPV